MDPGLQSKLRSNWKVQLHLLDVALLYDVFSVSLRL